MTLQKEAQKVLEGKINKMRVNHIARNLMSIKEYKDKITELKKINIEIENGKRDQELYDYEKRNGELVRF